MQLLDGLWLSINWAVVCVWKQLLLKSETRHYAQGAIIADSRDDSRGLVVITSGQVTLHFIEEN